MTSSSGGPPYSSRSLKKVNWLSDVFAILTYVVTRSVYGIVSNHYNLLSSFKYSCLSSLYVAPVRVR